MDSRGYWSDYKAVFQVWQHHLTPGAGEIIASALTVLAHPLTRQPFLDPAALFGLYQNTCQEPQPDQPYSDVPGGSDR